MTKHLLRDLENLKKQILTVGSMVEEAIAKSTTALLERRADLAQQVLVGDSLIDATEVLVEEECLKVLALHQPVAADLRFIVTVLKANADLERMGDLAENVSERAAFLATHEPLRTPPEFRRMVEQVRTMVREALDALVDLDTTKARKVLTSDAEVDRTNREMFGSLQELMMRDPSTVTRALHTLSASRNLERIADHATNIAEDVIFLCDGQIIRHRGAGNRGQTPSTRRREEGV